MQIQRRCSGGIFEEERSLPRYSCSRSQGSGIPGQSWGFEVQQCSYMYVCTACTRVPDTLCIVLVSISNWLSTALSKVGLKVMAVCKMISRGHFPPRELSSGAKPYISIILSVSISGNLSQLKCKFYWQRKAIFSWLLQVSSKIFPWKLNQLFLLIWLSQVGNLAPYYQTHYSIASRLVFLRVSGQDWVAIAYVIFPLPEYIQL